MTASTPKRSLNVENDQAVNTMALAAIQTTLKAVQEEIAAIKETLGWTGQDEHGGLIGTGIAGNLARLEKRVDRRFAIYDGVTRYAAGATATAVVMGAVLWFVIKHKLEAFFQ
jgi:hypothetical protein